MNVGTIASVKNQAEEAMETAAQTKAEAAKGDQQAVRKLATAQPKVAVQNEPHSVGNGRRRLDATA